MFLGKYRCSLGGRALPGRQTVAKLTVKIGEHTLIVKFDEDALPPEALLEDACCGTYGELLASLLLARYNIDSVEEVFDKALAIYLQRIFVEELKRLIELFANTAHRLRLPVITPLLLRMSRLAKLYPWLKPAYNERLAHHARDLLELSVKAARETNVGSIRGRILVLNKNDVEELKQGGKARSIVGRFEAIGKAVATAVAQQILSPSIIAEGLSTKAHPLLRDPLAGVRVNGVPVASLLASFEDQLYTITGVNKALNAVRAGGIRAAKKLVADGFITAVVKDYSSPIAAKWLVASILTLHLPRPILGAKKRLLNELEYTLRLEELGFNVHRPLLIDPRRLRAAYSYVEGEDLASILKRAPVPPHYRDLGALLATLHASGIALWDTNPSNFVVDRLGSIYIVDLEQARELKSIEEAAWDIAMGLYYSAVYSPRDAPSRAKLLAEGYLDAGGKREIVIEAAKPKYMTPFIVAVAPPVLERIRKALLHAAGLGAASRNI